MLAEGRLPEGYAVKKRKLVKLEKVAGHKHGNKHGNKHGKGRKIHGKQIPKAA